MKWMQALFLVLRGRWRRTSCPAGALSLLQHRGRRTGEAGGQYDRGASRLREAGQTGTQVVV
ncbi:MAG TPA: hypothetical protein DEF41_13245 [Desulfovibrio sp.]|nr:hypothetical protein [Desulfovibrio sp.]